MLKKKQGKVANLEFLDVEINNYLIVLKDFVEFGQWNWLKCSN